MPLIDLRDYVVHESGTWKERSELKADATPAVAFTLAETRTATRFMLRWNGDAVYLAGPLRVRVTFQAENLLYGLGAYTGTSDINGADMVRIRTKPASGDLGKGSVREPSEAQPVFEKFGSSASGETIIYDTGGSGTGDSESDEFRIHEIRQIPTGAASIVASTVYSYTLDIAAGQVWPFVFREETTRRRFGANFGFRVLIEPAFASQSLVPAAPACDLPCDFAVADLPNTGQFFPSACEPCGTAVSYGLPPGTVPTLAIPSADGGCVRTRFFNGMFITREDFETEQRYQRMKARLHNRAAGQGVVWGLHVGKQGNNVCVLPGYAVDCCGNDLTVTTLYQIDGAVLLRDPAAVRALAMATGPVRMHLLLEHVECPSDPRPVHADPCASGSDRCETSRVRETVRLRLVPPRDRKPAAPIQKFLDEVNRLRARYGVTDDVAETPIRTPFELAVTVTTTQGDKAHARIVPGQASDLTELNRQLGSLVGVRTITVQVVRLDPRLRISNGTLDLTVDGTSIRRVSLGRDDREFTMPPATFDVNEGLDSTMVYDLADWVAEAPFAPGDGPRITGGTKLTFTFDKRKVTVSGIDRGLIARRPNLAPSCDREPCAPEDERRAELGASRDRERIERAASPTDELGEPKAVVLAALGGWLTQLLARERAGTSQDEQSMRRMIAGGLYDAAWLLLFGVDPRPDAQRELLRAIQELLRAWCERLLWKGPQCEGDPHGVVIGCTTVTAGAIGEIDPFGGRRWVLHAPLVTHWAEQLGVAPIDATVSQLFSTLCCVASLPTYGAHPELRAMATELGAGYLTFGPPDAVASKLRDEYHLQIGESHTLAFADFVHTAIAMVRSDDPPPKGSDATHLRPVRRYTLGDPFAPKVLGLIVSMP